MDTVAERAPPYMDAANDGMDGWELPRISRCIDDGELIVLLAALREPSGKHRFSANQIHTLVGGERNTVLARVKEIRAGNTDCLSGAGTRATAGTRAAGPAAPVKGAHE
jgi:hypothetical protein